MPFYEALDFVQDVRKRLELLYKLLEVMRGSSALIECVDQVLDKETDGDNIANGRNADRHGSRSPLSAIFPVLNVLSIVSAACQFLEGRLDALQAVQPIARVVDGIHCHAKGRYSTDITRNSNYLPKSRLPFSS